MPLAESTLLVLLPILFFGLVAPELFRKLKLPYMTSLILVETLTLPGVIEATIGSSLPARTLVVFAVVAPLSLLLGFCFPIGMQLVDRISTSATAWMWGVNGGFDVLGSMLAAMVSLWFGIHTSLLIAAGLYLALAIAARGLGRRAFATTRGT